MVPVVASPPGADCACGARCTKKEDGQVVSLAGGCMQGDAQSSALSEFAGAHARPCDRALKRRGEEAERLELCRL